MRSSTEQANSDSAILKAVGIVLKEERAATHKLILSALDLEMRELRESIQYLDRAPPSVELCKDFYLKGVRYD